MTSTPPHPGDPWHPEWKADTEGDRDDLDAGESSVEDFEQLRPAAAEGQIEAGPAGQPADDADDDGAETGEIPVTVATEPADAAGDEQARPPVSAAPEREVDGAAQPEHVAAPGRSSVPDAAAEVGAAPAPDPSGGAAGHVESGHDGTDDLAADRGPVPTPEPGGGPPPVPVDEDPDDVMWDEMAAALIEPGDGASSDDWDVMGGMQPLPEGEEEGAPPPGLEGGGPSEEDIVPAASDTVSPHRRRWWRRRPTVEEGEVAEPEAPVVEPSPAIVPRVEILEEPATDEIPVVEASAGTPPYGVQPPAADVRAEEAPAVDDEEPTTDDDEPATDEVPLPSGFGGIDDLTEEAFVALSTMEHRGLANVAAEEGDATEVQALAAPMPGIDTGVLGFEDVVGDVAEEEVAAIRTRPKPQFANLLARVATGVVLGVVVVVAVWAGASAVAALATAVFLLALGEYYGVLVKSGYRPLSLFGLLGGAGALLGARVWGLVAVPGALIVTALVVFFFFALAPSRQEPLVNGALTVGGTAWVAGLGAFVMPLLDANDFRLLVFSIVAVTVFMDIAQYFAGKSWGYRRIAPILSPNKTFAGLVGGAITVVAMGIALGNVEPFDSKTGLILAAAIVVAGPLGDLSVSAFKRAVGVKDMGGILPGHGGVLDRVDALLFTFPAGWLVFRWLGYLM